MTGGNIRTLIPGVPNYGLNFPARVDAYLNTTNFACSALTGYGNDFFVGYWCMVIWDGGGAGVPPQGEARMITDYVSATGFFTHAAFSVPISTGDIVLLIHPTQFEPVAMRGGAQTVQSLHDNQQAMLDLAEYATATYTFPDNNENTFYAITGQANVFFFAGGFIDWTGCNAGAGEDTTVKVKVKVDGTNYRVIYEETFLAAAVPVPAVTPFPRSVNTKPTPEGFYSKQDVLVSVQQAANGGGLNTIDIRIIDAVRGS